MSGYGPQAGDVVILGDTGLRLRIPERVPDAGDELHVGFAKTGRDGIGLAPVTTRESCDVVLTNVIVVDAVAGIKVASIGIRNGRISGIGKAGNPNTTAAVDVVVGSGTVVISADGMIATAGGIDTHVHSITPRVFDSLIASGITTVLSQEAGPVWGVGLGSRWFLETAHKAMDAFPINIGLLGRASTSSGSILREAIEGHVCAFKVHEDTGATLSTIDTALRTADEIDVQVALHTDGLNETLSVADTLAVISGRAIHAYHVEGCGGGHAPDVLTLAGHDNVLASSTNPTLPYGSNAVAEHLDMILLCHGMNSDRDADIRIARARVRGVTMAAENQLHDRGVIPITSSDAQGMGRAGETWWRTFAMASVLRPLDEGSDDNDRILRYLAKVTINPALAHGLAHEVGKLEEGLLADIVLWSPNSFAAKPWLVLKSGFPAWGESGNPNSSLPDTEPLQVAEQFGAMGAAPAELSYLITNKIAAAEQPLPSARRAIVVQNTRSVRGSDMIRHGNLGTVTVNPDGSKVRWNGEALTGTPVHHVPISRLHFW
jgi:urease subunit alpha